MGKFLMLESASGIKLIIINKTYRTLKMIREDVATRYILDLWEQTHAVEAIKIKLARKFHHDISSSEIIAILETYQDILTDIPETFEKHITSTTTSAQKIDP